MAFPYRPKKIYKKYDEYDKSVNLWIGWLAKPLALLLHRLFHADGVHHQLKLLQDVRLVALNVVFNRLVGQQLGQVALGHRQVEQVGAVVLLCVFYLLS